MNIPGDHLICRCSSALVTLITLSFLFQSAFADETAVDQEVLAEPSVTTGKIVFFRTGRGGGAVKFHVHTMEGDPVGYLGKKGDNFAIDVEPGTHQYWSRAASRNDVIITVEADQTYYVKAVVKMGAAVGRPVLELIPASKAPKNIVAAYSQATTSEADANP